MFIEDQDLLRLASLPFARQVSVGSGPEPLTSGTAAQQLRAFAGARLTVICPPDLALTSGFEAWLNDHAAAHPVQLRIEPPVGDPAALHQHLVDLGCGLLALAADSAEAQLLELMAGAACNLLVMR